MENLKKYSNSDLMLIALEQAKLAQSIGEVPVGAVIVFENQIIAVGHNNCITKKDPSEHAEINVIRKAANMVNNYRLVNCELYVTLEPCMMCLGAIIHSRISKLYYGATDPKTGALGGLVDLTKYYKTNHNIEIYQNILEEQSSKLLQNFFLTKRENKKIKK